MSNEIYFSKVEFNERIGYGNIHSTMLLDIGQHELSYQVFAWEKQMPTIVGTDSYEINGNLYNYEVSNPGKMVKSANTDFKKKMLIDEQYNQKVVFSYGLKLTDEQLEELLPFCNAAEFEPYRNKEMSMNDEGYIGYRDEVSIYFTGITDSFIPKMEWEMRYYYDEEHIWPSEKLYRYLVNQYFQDNKKLKGWGPNYGGLSLFV